MTVIRTRNPLLWLIPVAYAAIQVLGLLLGRSPTVTLAWAVAWGAIGIVFVVNAMKPAAVIVDGTLELKRGVGTHDPNTIPVAGIVDVERSSPHFANLVLEDGTRVSVELDRTLLDRLVTALEAERGSTYPSSHPATGSDEETTDRPDDAPSP